MYIKKYNIQIICHAAVMHTETESSKITTYLRGLRLVLYDMAQGVMRYNKT